MHIRKQHQVKKVLHIVSNIFPTIMHTRFLPQSSASQQFTTHIYPSHYTPLSPLPYAALHYISLHFTSLHFFTLLDDNAHTIYPSPSIFTTLLPIYILPITRRFHPFPTLHFTTLPCTSLNMLHLETD